MDREFAVVLRRALLMIVRYLEERFGLGGPADQPGAGSWPTPTNNNTQT